MTRIFLIAAAAFIFIGRLTIPGHGLTGWPGFYEAIAHIVLGGMIFVALFYIWVWISLALEVLFKIELPVWDWPSFDASRGAFWLVLLLSLFELVMFELQKG